jgi:hypothetical protein
MPRFASAFVVALLLVPACGGDDSAVSPDANPNAPDGASACDPTTVLPAGWTPVAKVSAGAVTSTGTGTITTTVDATAGGFNMSSTEPYVYVSFEGGAAAKVSIDDPTSYGSSDWDLAFKRYVIRGNGGDSGPGGVQVAPVNAATLAEVTTVPPAQSFAVDDWTDANCALVPDLVGSPVTAFNPWYDASSGMLTPLQKVYVVKLRDGSTIKLRIVTYYGDPADASKSAVLKLEWAAL